MSTVWNTYRIEDIADKITIGPFGSRMKSDAYVESGVPVIRGTNLTGSKKFSGDWVFISEQLAKQLENCCVSNGDLVFPHRGSIGEVGLVDNQFHQYMMSSSLMKLRCNPNIADSEFIYYFFKSHQGRYELLKNASQVGTPGIGQPLTSLKNIEIKLPSLGEQRKIAKILSDLDDKIHINNQINQTLESIAQALFKSWFVDFDPVRAKIAAKQEGKDAELAAMCAISGKSEIELQQMAEDDFAALRATAALFPDGLVESELGEVPKGWEVGKLQEVIDLNPRRTLKKDSLAPYLDMKNVRTQGHLVDEVILRNMTSGTKFINGDTLLARITPCLENGKTAYVDFLLDNEVGWGSTEFIVLRPKEHLPTALGYFIARQENFRTLAIQSMTGTSGRQRANADTLANQSWLIYPADLMIVFDKYAGKYLTHIKNNGLQNGILKNIRDALLPKLLSGELDATLLKK
ncbi:restriction endonuclease subunit S [Acinetobacter ursingii]|uniref:restriction endonuclease subunit S n=1 Tax=Acinetobacter ursingii TaxID=108980 RepID=UPI0021D21D91|nr:restriction endonuclease subunit S [Acinetobacter ursingii]MCU4489424.1 restriction endonuclease subunit S [Acinetobacter ursingii]